jgi:hypothetical protein
VNARAEKPLIIPEIASCDVLPRTGAQKRAILKIANDM